MNDHKKLAEEIAEFIFKDFSSFIEYPYVRRVTENYVKGMLSEQETEDLIEAVDSLIQTAEVKVILSKVRP